MLKKILLAICGVTLLAILGTLLFVEDFEIALSEQDVQSAIDRQISIGPIVHLGTSLDLRTAKIDFLNNNTAQLDVDFDASGFGYSGTVIGNVATGFEYRAPELSLSDLKFENLDVTLDEKTSGKLKDVTNVARDFLKRQREEMLTDDARESLDNLVTGENSLIEQKMEAAIKWFISTMPIYNLNNAGLKGSAASLALKSVRFTEQTAVVTLSPRQAIIKVLTIIGISILLLSLFAAQFAPALFSKSTNGARASSSESQLEEEE